jgi:hypothetical protein
MGVDLVIPYIETTPIGVVGDTAYRSRIDPDAVGNNVAISGAGVGSLVRERAGATNPDEIADETDLVMYPRIQSQLEYVESVAPKVVFCWIGSNDALGAVLDFNRLDASQLTSVQAFEKDYIELTDRLGALADEHGTKVVFANIPDVTRIGFLLDRARVEAFLGYPVDLPDGHYTSLVAVILMSLAGNSELLQDPAFVLDDEEVAIISDRIKEFNRIIGEEAQRIDMPVVNVDSWFASLSDDPPTFFGVALAPELLRGVFSLDTVHPSNIAHALLANEIIKVMNSTFGTAVPPIDQKILSLIFLLDPSIDKDFDGRARGRLGVGLLESLAFLVGITGDFNDKVSLFDAVGPASAR